MRSGTESTLEPPVSNSRSLILWRVGLVALVLGVAGVGALIWWVRPSGQSIEVDKSAVFVEAQGAPVVRTRIRHPEPTSGGLGRQFETPSKEGDREVWVRVNGLGLAQLEELDVLFRARSGETANQPIRLKEGLNKLLVSSQETFKAIVSNEAVVCHWSPDSRVEAGTNPVELEANISAGVGLSIKLYDGSGSDIAGGTFQLNRLSAPQMELPMWPDGSVGSGFTLSDSSHLSPVTFRPACAGMTFKMWIGVPSYGLVELEITLPFAGEVLHMDVEMPRASSPEALRAGIRVLDEEGVPVSQASVLSLAQVSGYEDPEVHVSGGGLTNERGEAVIETRSPGSAVDFAVRVRKAGFGAVTVVLRLQAGDARDFMEVRIFRATLRIAGAVKLLDGAPAPGVTVTYVPPHGNFSNVGWREARKVVTDAEGRFEFTEVADGQAEVYAQSPHYLFAPERYEWPLNSKDWLAVPFTAAPLPLIQVTTSDGCPFNYHVFPVATDQTAGERLASPEWTADELDRRWLHQQGRERYGATGPGAPALIPVLPGTYRVLGWSDSQSVWQDESLVEVNWGMTQVSVVLNPSGRTRSLDLRVMWRFNSQEAFRPAPLVWAFEGRLTGLELCARPQYGVDPVWQLQRASEKFRIPKDQLLLAYSDPQVLEAALADFKKKYHAFLRLDPIGGTRLRLPPQAITGLDGQAVVQVRESAESITLWSPILGVYYVRLDSAQHEVFVTVSELGTHLDFEASIRVSGYAAPMVGNIGFTSKNAIQVSRLKGGSAWIPPLGAGLHVADLDDETTGKALLASGNQTVTLDGSTYATVVGDTSQPANLHLTIAP